MSLDAQSRPNAINQVDNEQRGEIGAKSEQQQGEYFTEGHNFGTKMSSSGHERGKEVLELVAK